MTNLPGKTALKEWAAVCSAICAGDQLLILRKGGIHERSFATPESEFFLFPTYLHQGERQFKPEFVHHLEAAKGRSENDPIVPISAWCRIAASFEVTDLDLLLELEPFVIFCDETIRDRYAFRPDQAVRLLVVRAMLLPAPVSVLNQRRYAGCRSWIHLDEEIDVAGSVPVLTDDVFASRLGEIEAIVRVPRAVTPLG